MSENKVIVEVSGEWRVVTVLARGTDERDPYVECVAGESVFRAYKWEPINPINAGTQACG